MDTLPDGEVICDRRSFSEAKTWEDCIFARRDEDEEEALKWAAIEKLPSFRKLRRAVLSSVDEKGQTIHEEVDASKLSPAAKQQLLQRLVPPEDPGNERLLRKMRERVDKVGVELPNIEVRFQHLNVQAEAHVGSRALPTLWNFTYSIFEGMLETLHVSRSKKKPFTILHDISGIVKPSRLTLLLGPPSSGKSTLLQALAGKLSKDLRVTGQILYNGHDFTEFIPQRTAAYISQHDLHVGELTVRETIDFSARCQVVGQKYGRLMEILRREKAAGINPDPDIDAFVKAVVSEGQETNIFTDYIIKVSGLDTCADMLVGDAMRRGISGGQKRRLTSAEMIVGPAKAIFMDEISTGLDSSTTYHIIKCLENFVHLLDATIIISLLQPTPETYKLFDDLILLSEGHIIYQGPCQNVLEFFEMVGFRCPERKNVADYLQEITSKKDQQQYWAHKSQPYKYITAKDFVDAFTKFHIGERIAAELMVPFDKSKSHPAALATKKYGLSNWNILKVCLAREWLLMKRNSFVYIFKTTQISIISTIAMTMFLRTQHHLTVTDGNVLMGSLFFGIVIIMLNGLTEMSLTVNRLPVFYKQRDYFFYPAWAFSIPTFIMRIPLSFLESSIWVLLTYFVIGYAPEAKRFFRQFLLLFCTHVMSMGLFRTIASLGRNMVIASTCSAFALLVLFVLGGFVVARGSIHPWWIWGYWISPLMYGQNAIAVNEFLAPRWNKVQNGSSDTIGLTVLRSRGMFPHAYWYWIGIGALLGFVILFNIVFTLALKFLNPLGKHQASIAETILDENATESVFPSTKNTKYSTSSKQPDICSTVEENKSNMARRGMILPFQPFSMAFHHINYYVDMPAEMKQEGADENRLQLLQDVSGAFKPGVLTALMGVSGAGKTTLLDVLSGRKTGGYIEGSISISGFPKNQETFSRISGYCEQTDIHSPHVTIHEALIYSSWLRLSRDIDKKTRTAFVEEIMELVELTPVQDAIVGLPGVNGLSTEQRKRLTIAVELVANPSILFMDEPTSGLDARSAAIVMRTVRNAVDTGRAVICTIHQPNIEIFEAFDELLLMQRGGRVIYAGPLGTHSSNLIDYFQEVDGIERMADGYNAATWMLEVTSTSIEEQLGVSFADIYCNSSLYKRNEMLIEELSKPVPGAKDLFFSTRYAQSFITQCMACLWKQYWSYWRNPHYCVVRLFFTTICALLFGSVFWKFGKKKSTQQEVFNMMGSMYAATIFMGVSNASSVQPVVGVERSVSYRERGAGMYSAFPYAIAQLLIEVPYVLLQVVVYGIIVYLMISFEWAAAKFFWYIFFVFCSLLYYTYYGMMTVAVTPNHTFAAVIASAFYGVWNLFSGFLVSYPKMPVWWRWYYWLNPVAWTLNGLVTSQLGDNETYITIPGQASKTIKQYLKDYFGFHEGFLSVVAAMHIVFVITFAFIFAFAIKFLNFQKR